MSIGNKYKHSDLLLQRMWKYNHDFYKPTSKEDLILGFKVGLLPYFFHQNCHFSEI